MRANVLCRALLMGCLFFAPAVHAHEGHVYMLGDKVDLFEAKDQHDRPYKFKVGTRYLLVSFGGAVAKKVNKILAAKGAQYLEQKKAVYLEDVYELSSFTRRYKLSKMQKYPHTIILLEGERSLDRYPMRRGKVAVLDLDPQGKVLQMRLWDPSKKPIDAVLGG